MNITDFKDIEVATGDMLETIFNHQRDLMDKYHSIEEKNVGHLIPSSRYIIFNGNIFGPFNASGPICKGCFILGTGCGECERCRWELKHPHWLYAGPLNINDRASQLRFKDFAWRITEELTEATLALGESDETHYLEELIDALHFSVELLIMCGIEPINIEDGTADKMSAVFMYSDPPSLQTHRHGEIAYHAIEKLGEAMNRLKGKPWKTTMMLTDEKAFKQSMIAFFAALIDLLKASGFTAHSATIMYLQKNKVNQFRQGSGY